MSRAHIRPDISLSSGKRRSKLNCFCGELLQTLSSFDFILNRTCRASAPNIPLTTAAGISKVDCGAFEGCFKYGHRHTYLQDFQGLMLS
jgi:hypothetical protein